MAIVEFSLDAAVLKALSQLFSRRPDNRIVDNPKFIAKPPQGIPGLGNPGSLVPERAFRLCGRWGLSAQ